MPTDSHRNLLAVLAHPDDEFAVFPVLAQAARVGRAVHCVYLTDGGFGGQDVARRCRESAGALVGLGVRPEYLHFLGTAWSVPDGSLHEHLGRVIPALIEAALALTLGGELLAPAWEGGHHDHDAAHLAALALARAAGGAPLRQFPLYQGAGLPGPLFRVLSPLSENGAYDVVATTLSERIDCLWRCRHYRSQWRSFAGLLPPYLARMRRRDAFVLQPSRIERTAERPHAGPLLYERRGGPSWDEFAGATRPWRHPFPT